MLLKSTKHRRCRHQPQHQHQPQQPTLHATASEQQRRHNTSTSAIGTASTAGGGRTVGPHSKVIRERATHLKRLFGLNGGLV